MFQGCFEGALGRFQGEQLEEKKLNVSKIFYKTFQKCLRKHFKKLSANILRSFQPSFYPRRDRATDLPWI